MYLHVHSNGTAVARKFHPDLFALLNRVQIWEIYALELSLWKYTTKYTYAHAFNEISAKLSFSKNKTNAFDQFFEAFDRIYLMHTLFSMTVVGHSIATGQKLVSIHESSNNDPHHKM